VLHPRGARRRLVRHVGVFLGAGRGQRIFMKLRGSVRLDEIFPVVYFLNLKIDVSVEKLHFRAVTALEGSTHPTRTSRGAPVPPPATPSTVNRHRGVHVLVMERNGRGDGPESWTWWCIGAV
jgi:hypothetical protein